jgi:ABC-2 type transport system ATP-binding protein
MIKPLITLEINDLQVSYGKNLALTVDQAKFEGNTLALIGHNGAGKSTFIKTVLKLLVPKCGSVLVNFNSLQNNKTLDPAQDMAFCPESGAVFSDITVESYIKLWCRFKKNDSSFYKKKGSKYIEALEISPLLSKLGRELSKGQKRRVQTAIGFLVEPSCFLIDEPFDGLDVQKTHELAQVIRENSTNMTFIISSHRMDVMERISDFIMVIKEGKFVSFGTLEKVSVDLSGATHIIDLMGNEDYNTVNEVESYLQTVFPNDILNKVPNGLALTSKTATLETINNALEAKWHTNFKWVLKQVTPSLVDAMTFHLKNS